MSLGLGRHTTNAFFVEEMMERIRNYFTKTEWVLWGGSVVLITVAFFLSEKGGLSYFSSFIGVTSLIFAAKGNPIGQILMILFSLLYGWISYSFSYFGEMITYLGMTLPMAAVSLIAWIRHPYEGKHSEVEVNRLKKADRLALPVLTVCITVVFYFLLRSLHTANLLPSTFSVATSFAAAYLTFRRSALFALAYAFNDAVLILLWALASVADRSYLSVVMCFSVFLVNDLYGYYSWKVREKTQQKISKND